MSPNGNILIYVDEIQSGKTTRVLDWIKNKDNVSGFLTPDVGEKRRFYDITERKLYDFETDMDSTEATISIGKYVFLAAIFNKAQYILKAAIKTLPNWLIIDEIGKLELENKGLEPALGEVLNQFISTQTKTKILLIVRDSLLERAIQKYHLQNAQIIDYTYFLKPEN